MQGKLSYSMTKADPWLRVRSGLCSCAVLCVVAPSWASTGIRPLFEPTDLELEDPGVVDFDFQLGVIRGRDPWRVVIPDFEFDFGVIRNVELDLDGTYAIQGTSHSPFTSPQAVPDALWTSVKLGLLDWYNGDTKRAWAFGLQLGPKFPVAKGNQGVGAEGLLLSGLALGDTHFVLNTGMRIDPRPSPDAQRPVGIEVGLDIHTSLDHRDRYAFLGEISGVRYLSDYPHELLTTAGLQMSPTKYLDMSIVALWGWLGGSDRYGLLLGVSPKIRILGSD